MLDLIAFDADDTLWDNERLYTQSKEKFMDLLSECADRAACKKRLDEIEWHNVRYYGYGIKSFILSMVEAALEITSENDGAIVVQTISTILGYAKEMLSAEVLLIDGAAETLASLAPRYPLMLITKGDPSEQQRKIDDSGLKQFFRWVEIVGEKSPSVYRAILERYNIPPERFLMVGNSPRSDILPVLQIGGKAVLVPYADTWAHEMEVSLPPGMHYDTLPGLSALPSYVDQLTL